MLTFDADLLVSWSVIFFSIGLFVYWGTRAVLLKVGSEEEVTQVLHADLAWGRRVWLNLRSWFGPSAQLLSP